VMHDCSVAEHRGKPWLPPGNYARVPCFHQRMFPSRTEAFAFLLYAVLT
jgi:hypothetical protein